MYQGVTVLATYSKVKRALVLPATDSFAKHRALDVRACQSGDHTHGVHVAI